MKKIIYVLIIGLITLASCTGVKTTTSGLENEAFLEFIGIPANYSAGVDVKIDDKTPFKALVNADHADRPKGSVYAIATGTHIIVVSYNNNVLIKKQIFIASQETKKIMLP